jgi:hypothetical protein
MEKRFLYLIRYLELICLFSAAFCLVMMYMLRFDPWQSLDSLLWKDLYGSPQLPQIALPAYEFIFRLFCWLSLITFSLLFLIVHYPLRNREKWAFYAILFIALAWPAGAALSAFLSEAYSYLFSATAMLVLFLPPVLLLYPYFRAEKQT